MGKFKKSIIALGLSLVTVVSAVSLGIKTPSAYATVSDVEFWSTYSTDKVLRDMTDIYDDMKSPAVINVEAIGGEEEGGQIIMTTGNKAVASYNAEITDLYAGEEKFSKENIIVYHQKYIYTAGRKYYDLEGFFPDCLAPFENVKAIGENVIAKNNNQGVYVSFEVPEDQAPGTYTGTLSITIGEEKKNIPVTLTVADASIGIENHSKSCFSLMWGHPRGELDSTEEMMDIYIDMLTEYRLGPNHMLYRTNHTAKEMEIYALKACRQTKDPKAMSYGLPYETVTVKDYVMVDKDGNQTVAASASIYDQNIMTGYYRAFFYEGLKQGVNPFKKLFVKGVDEPGMWGMESALHTLSYSFKQAKDTVIAEMRNDKSIVNQQLLEEMIASLIKVPHVVTSSVAPEGFDAETMEIVYCPYFSKLGTEEARDSFKISEETELWWYGCNVPREPYPTYHMCNTLLSPRLCSWMQADYDIIGNLYWATEYSKGANADGSNFLEDYYESNSMRTTSTSGEGFLLYPGAKYGVNGPLPSLRLEAVRDGLEEYEMIYKLRQYYEAKGFDEDNVMNVLYDTMYNGSKIYEDIDGETFAKARARLIDLLELAESDANVMITDVKDVRGKSVFTVYCNDGYSIDISDKFSVKEQSVDGGKLYTVTCAGEENAFVLKTTVGEKTYQISFDIGLTVPTFYTAEYFAQNGAVKSDNIYAQEITLETQLVDAKTINENELEDGLKYTKLSIGASATVQQSILIDDTAIKNFNAKTQKVVIELYNDSTEEVETTLYYKGTSGPLVLRKTVNLKPGLNEIVFDGMATINWSTIRQMQYFRLTFGKVGDAARDNIYFVGITEYRN